MRPCESDVAGGKWRSFESREYEGGGYENENECEYEYEYEGMNEMGKKGIFLYEMKRVRARLVGEDAMAAIMTGV